MKNSTTPSSPRLAPLAALALLIAGSLFQTAPAKAVTLTARDNSIVVRLDEGTGLYEITVREPEWIFGGALSGPVTNASTHTGVDRIGPYQEITFSWIGGAMPLAGSIRLYNDRPLILFSDTCRLASEVAPPAFPNFTVLPQNLYHFSYANRRFSPPVLSLDESSTPWMLFDAQDNAMIISPASHFFIATMRGDGRRHLSSSFNDKLRGIPAGFTQETLFAVGKGINHTWDAWGTALTDLSGKTRPHSDADVSLKYFGYWTDNFAHYYYNYDQDKGYAGTLVALAEHYRQEKIPIHYLQLDSWWYYKTLTDPDGRLGKPKNASLPKGEWNRYGGLLEYRAHTDLFPNGLAAFHEAAELPFITHNRWIDPLSPYHQRYKISGLAAVDPLWWDDITAYLKSSGVITYEQDWLDEICYLSPEFVSTVDAGQSFLDNMARACKNQGLTMQYCMALPRCFLQGSAYDNLTTIRTSDDGFQPARYNDFIYTSRLASALGIWPWSDVFRSTDSNSILLSTLSAGPVGIGDAIGKESKTNIFMSVRADGVIVKPDAPIVPLDRTYITDAELIDEPLLASTFTNHGGLKTAYVFAFRRPKRLESHIHFTPAELGLTGRVYVYDYNTHTTQRLNSSEAFSTDLNAAGVGYYIVAPVSRSGVGFLGDEGKFVSTGKNRVPSLVDEPGGLSVSLTFAAAERSITLHGCAASAPRVSVQGGTAAAPIFDPVTGHFSVEIQPDVRVPPETSGGDSIRHVMVQFQLRQPKKMSQAGPHDQTGHSL